MDPQGLVWFYRLRVSEYCVLKVINIVLYSTKDCMFNVNILVLVLVFVISAAANSALLADFHFHFEDYRQFSLSIGEWFAHSWNLADRRNSDSRLGRRPQTSSE